MRRKTRIRRALPVAVLVTASTITAAALVGSGHDVYGSGLPAPGLSGAGLWPRPSGPARGAGMPAFVARFYADLVPRAIPAAEVSPTTLIGQHVLTFHSRDEDELANVLLAVQNIDGAVVAPGAVFSYNDTVGERTEERGFRPGLMYMNGQVVSDIGGGVCIPSTGLYNAALQAGMEIVERYHHSGPVSYAAPGLDAAVVFGQKDFQFRNTSSEPVTIHASVLGDMLTVTLSGRASGRRVEITTGGYGTVAFQEEKVSDPEVPQGQPVVEQEGRAGYVVTVYRTVYEGRKVVQRETVNHDVVAARNRIVRMNPLDIPDSPEALAKAAEAKASDEKAGEAPAPAELGSPEVRANAADPTDVKDVPTDMSSTTSEPTAPLPQPNNEPKSERKPETSGTGKASEAHTRNAPTPAKPVEKPAETGKPAVVPAVTPAPKPAQKPAQKPAEPTVKPLAPREAATTSAAPPSPPAPQSLHSAAGEDESAKPPGG